MLLGWVKAGAADLILSTCCYMIKLTLTGYICTAIRLALGSTILKSVLLQCTMQEAGETLSSRSQVAKDCRVTCSLGGSEGVIGSIQAARSSSEGPMRHSTDQSDREQMQGGQGSEGRAEIGERN